MKNLLITIGCSFIEGAGATSHDTHFYCDEEKVKHGIGHNLQKKLNYDTLINIGIGSSGIERQLEYFLLNVDLERIKSEYEKITLFLFVTFPTRWNKYINGESVPITIEEMNLIPKIKNNQNPKNSYEDAVREQSMYINIFNELCKSNNWNFIWACVDDIQEEIYKNLNLVNSIEDLMPSQFEGNQSWIPYVILDREKWRASDGHPNKDGYKFISNKMVEWIQKNRPELKNYNISEYEIYSILSWKISKVNLNR